jgi:hypothetical protein
VTCSSSLPITDPSRCALVSLLIAQARQFRQLQRAELRLTNQIGAIERMLSGDHRPADTHSLRVADNFLEDESGHDAVEAHYDRVALVPPKSRDLTKLIAEIGWSPIVQARDYLTAHRKAAARHLEKQSVQLPVWEAFVRGVRGCGPLGLALIIGEAHDLDRYANPAKLWKRMGLAVMPDGRCQRRVAETEAGLLNGYSPRRRSLMHVLGDSLVKLNDGAYRAAYDSRKAYELERAPDMRLGVAHKRAMRYMEKRFLLHLWQAWRRETTAVLIPIDRASLDADVHDEVLV